MSIQSRITQFGRKRAALAAGPANAFQPAPRFLVVVSGVQWALFGEALLSLLLGALVVWRGLDRAVSTVLGIFFAVWSVLLFLAVPFLDGDVPGWATRIWILFRAGLVSLTFALMAVYPTGRSMRQKRWMLRLAAVPVLVAGLGALADHYPPFSANLPAFLYFLVTNLASPLAAYTPALWFLFHAYRTPDGPRRMQYAGAAAALLIWIMNDGLPPLAFWTDGMRILDMNGYMQAYAAGSLLGMLATVALVVLIVLQGVTGRRGWSASLTVGGWAVLAVGLAQLQELPGRESSQMVVHLAVDMATYLILFYLVARSQLLDVALARPSFTTRGFAVAIGLTALIATQVMLEEAFGSAFGWFGAVLAGAAVAATIPLQQRLERFRSGPSMVGGQYEAFRRMQVYHAAVEGALHDGQLGEGDNTTLANLRQALGVGREDHERLVADLVSRG